MKSLLTAIAFVFICSTGYNQTCGTIISQSVVPNPVTESDPVWLNLQAYCSSNMWLDSFTVTPSGNSFMINVYYCVGMLTVITYTNDSIPFGILPAGNYNYIVNTYSSGDCITFSTADQDSGNFTVNPAGGTGIETISMTDFIISPNPFSDYLEINNTTSEQLNVTIALSDLNGKKINLPVIKNPGDKIILNTSALSSGIYFIEIHSGERTFYRKIIK